MEFVLFPRRGLILHWVPAAIGVAIIAAESTATMSASNTSRWLLPIWVYLFGPIGAHQWAEVHLAIRKTGHFVGYGLLCIAFFHGWKSSFHPASHPERLWRFSSCLAIVSTLIVATLDEYHQSFLPGRTSSAADVLLDLCGGIAAQSLVLAAMSYIVRRRSRLSFSQRE
jgi:VanZ family protein